ncbi:HalOD1 output domain-containing protein [Halorubrum distributum]|uniref:HalOD1 output domain-containing protein n=1 Tax=Halorubrum distributum TaxID=29283 RepID=UPI001268872F|nr:HalOD1 output domain-containing protein [Halorubrum arcis]
MERCRRSEGIQSITVEIVQKVATLEGKEVTDLPPLNQTIDIEAVERVAQTKDTRIEFRYLDYEVVVADGNVTINDR